MTRLNLLGFVPALRLCRAGWNPVGKMCLALSPYPKGTSRVLLAFALLPKAVHLPVPARRVPQWLLPWRVHLPSIPWKHPKGEGVTDRLFVRAIGLVWILHCLAH